MELDPAGENPVRSLFHESPEGLGALELLKNLPARDSISLDLEAAGKLVIQGDGTGRDVGSDDGEGDDEDEATPPPEEEDEPETDEAIAAAPADRLSPEARREVASSELWRLANELAAGGAEIDAGRVLETFHTWLERPLPRGAWPLLSGSVTLYEMWEGLATQMGEWRDLAICAESILAIPATSAHAERVVGKLRDILASIQFHSHDASLLARLQLAMDHEFLEGE
jgi:hypothetical protein